VFADNAKRRIFAANRINGRETGLIPPSGIDPLFRTRNQRDAAIIVQQRPSIRERSRIPDPAPSAGTGNLGTSGVDL